MRQVFESENISFVEVSEELINDYLVMVNDYEKVNRFIGGEKKTYTQEQEMKWVCKKLEAEAPVYSMIEKKSGRFIGNIELMDPAGRQAELGIAITGDMQDQGFGKEAIRSLTKHAFEQLGLNRIYLRTSPGNSRAIHVYEKCGFKEYKRDETHVYMEIMKET